VLSVSSRGPRPLPFKIVNKGHLKGTNIEYQLH
jgi:hypothetical protein